MTDASWPTSRSVLYVTYNGLTEPLGRRQVLPYLRRLADRGWRFTVLSFEKAETATPEARATVERLLEPAGIEWSPFAYHRRPSVPATTYDAAVGWFAGVRKRGRFGLLHARSTVPAWTVRWLSAFRRVPWVFDVRGLVAEEYVDAGHWPRLGLLHRTVGGLERRLMKKANGLVFLTHSIRADLVERWGFPENCPTRVIPCCVDTDVFRPSFDNRARVRAELGLGDDPVIAYSGSLGSWYKLGEMMEFYREVRRLLPATRFLILTPQIDLVEKALGSRRDLARGVVTRRIAPDDVPAHLAAADAGLCFLGDHPSKRASSPTKYGEYLASGLPVVTNAWTGDAARLSAERAWVTIEDFGPDERSRAAQALAEVLRDSKRAVAEARDLACREFALDIAISRYDSLYREVQERWQKPDV